MATPTYFGSAAVPADNGTNATATLTITPPGSMLTGDLVMVFCQSRVSGTWSVGVDGGQAWNALGAYSGVSNPFCRVFWCTFNGTWGASPRFDCTDATCTSAVMHVFRPDSTTKIWAKAVAKATQFVAPSTPFTCTRVGWTTTDADTVTMASFHTADDNTWGSLSGTGWVSTGTAQYRNLASTDQSLAIVHHLDGPAGSVVPDVSLNQTAQGGDAGTNGLFGMYATLPGSLIYQPTPMASYLAM